MKLLTDEEPSNRPEAKELKNHSLLLEFQESVKSCGSVEEKEKDEIESENKNDESGDEDKKDNNVETVGEVYWCH